MASREETYSQPAATDAYPNPNWSELFHSIIAHKSRTLIVPNGLTKLILPLFNLYLLLLPCPLLCSISGISMDFACVRVYALLSYSLLTYLKNIHNYNYINYYNYL